MMPVTFLWPQFLWLLLVVPLLIAAYVWLLRRRRKTALNYASLSIIRAAMGPVSYTHLTLPTIYSV